MGREAIRRACGVTCLAILAALTADGQSKPAQMSPAAQRALLDQYCVTCHNQKAKTGGLALDAMDLSRPGDNAETLEKVIRKLRAGMMPPAGSKRPDPATYAALTSGIESSVDQAALAKPVVVPPGVHRVNRIEYANSVRDLLGIEIDPAAFLPVDDASSGFDNLAGALTLSPALVEGYISAAGRIARLALGHETALAEKRYVVPGDRSQEAHVEGLPLGTRGGAVFTHNFPADGEYLISWYAVRDYNGVLFAGNRKGEKVEVLLDGERITLFEMDQVARITESLNEKNQVRVTGLSGGPHTVGVTFLSTTQVPIDDLNRHYQRSVLESGPLEGFTFSPQIGQIVITGPYHAAPAKDLPSRRKIMICEPAGSSEIECAKKILSELARKAYRRPIKSADLEDLLSEYQNGRNQSVSTTPGGDFESGIERALQAILADPEFVFRGETVPAGVKPGQPYRISDLELASRLSFFLWSSPPDDQLISLASQGTLKDSRVLEQQTRRMLADGRSRALVTNFGGQWLQLRNLASSSPVALDFPDFDDTLREAFKTETELLLESFIREDRNVAELLDADYTFVNERLARHYGIPNIYGSHFRRVQLDGEADLRRGLLGKGSIELITSLPDRTSPVQRGKWVLINILGIVPPNPPPGVPPFKESSHTEGSTPIELSMRQRMDEHRTNPVCASCHRMFDPIGFALESFDAIGRHRTAEFGKPLDLAGQLVDGAQFTGPTGLRQALLLYSPQFVQVLTEKLLTYALGRPVEYYDMPTVRAIAHDAARNNNRFSSLVLGIVKSTPFQMNAKPEEHLAARN